MFSGHAQITSRRILGTALLAALNCGLYPALAQSVNPARRRQSPLEISSRSKYDSRSEKITEIDSLKKPTTFTLKNDADSLWCDECGGRRVKREWATLKAYPPKDAAPRLKFGRDWYVLQQFHFHTPAEHLVDGELTPMEVHYVFRKEGPPGCGPIDFMVIGQRIRKGAENKELEKIFGIKAKLPEDYRSPSVEVPNFVIANVLVDLDRSYRYDGSLTAPANIGCPPGNPVQQLSANHFPQVVGWVLLATPIEMSEAQIARFHALFPEGNARKVQQTTENVTRTFR